MKTLAKSEALSQKSLEVLVGGVNSPVRAFRSVGGTPIFMAEGRGASLKDADGNRYLDFVLSWGPLILGHGHPKVVRAVKRQAARGLSFGAPTALELEMARLVRDAFPSMEKVRFTSSGTEAAMTALRLARGFTGRSKIVKFAGCYHGHSDSLLVKAGSGALTLGTPDSAGVPATFSAETLVLPYNDPESLGRCFSRWGGEIAAVIVEPVAANMGLVPPRTDFLQALRNETRRAESLMIFDEVITGFRLGWGGALNYLVQGGAQAHDRIQPDLTCLGKIIGGGMPVGAVGGRKDVMDQLAPLGPVYQAGTLSGNPAAMSAGIAALSELKRLNPYRALARRTQALAEFLRAESKRAGLQVQVQQLGSMFTVFFSDSPVADFESALRADAKLYARFFHALLERGIYFPPSQFETAFLSVVHSDSVLAKSRPAFREAFQSLKGKGNA